MMQLEHCDVTLDDQMTDVQCVAVLGVSDNLGSKDAVL